ncbi:hypothetical protein [Adhaeribacter rhizoryzae]|uniref:Transposase n=1 Tax=Adhaeribacter rhizoryzae TaxID=2607907 RepID=A0A5M6DQS2_9BACT|nr:hypothetical protein [Adhaeribacter rhizoryzae]KAA5547815.1 hypothetical protein F0145_07690 [Adhaeribacter rhizoryzae]
MTGLGKLCGLFGKSRQAYYQQLWQQDKNEVHQMVILEQVIKIRQQLPGIGTDKLHYLLTDFLAEHQLKLGRDKLYNLLRENHLLRTKRRKRAKTTKSQHPFYKYVNLVKELNFPPEQLAALHKITSSSLQISFLTSPYPSFSLVACGPTWFALGCWLGCHLESIAICITILLLAYPDYSQISD